MKPWVPCHLVKPTHQTTHSIPNPIPAHFRRAVFVHPRTRVLLPEPPRVVSIRAERAYAVTKRAVEHLPEQGRAIMGTLGLDKEHAEEKTLKDALVLLLFGLIAVLLFQKLPGSESLTAG